MKPPAIETPLLKTITLRNLLSFGPQTEPLELERLNVLIGPNGSGKSNLLEAIDLLRSSPTELRPVIANGGGIAAWIWQGQPNEPASIEAVVRNPHGPPLHHFLAFRRDEHFFRMHDERIWTEGGGKPKPFLYRFRQGEPIIAGKTNGRRTSKRDAIDPDLSILAQRRDPEKFPEITYLTESYDRIRLFREWTLGRSAIIRAPQRADLRTDRLQEDFSNLGLFLNRLRRRPVRTQLVSGLRDLYEGLTDFGLSVAGGTVQVFFNEGDFRNPRHAPFRRQPTVPLPVGDAVRPGTAGANRH